MLSTKKECYSKKMQNKLPERLKKLRADHGISQAKLAAIVGVAQQTVDKWEQRISQPDLDMLLQLTAYFEVSLDYLIGKTNSFRATVNEENSCATIDNGFAFVNTSKISINSKNKN